jgi:Zn-dependent metalloprotease
MSRKLHQFPLAVLAALLLAGFAQADDGKDEQVNRARGHLKSQKAQVSASDNDQFDATDSDNVIDDDGTEHVRFARKYKGLRVIGGDVVVHGSGDGKFQSATLTQAATLTLDTRPVVTTAAARSYAESLFGGTIKQASTAELVVYARSSTPVLAWDVAVTGTVKNAPAAMHYLIDAITGQLLDKWNDIQHFAATGSGHSLYAGDVTLSTDKQSSGYLLRDTTRGSHYVTNMATTIVGAGTVFSDADNVWGGAATDPATAAVDVANAQRLTWDFYKNVLGRKGLDNRGWAGYSRVHYDSKYAGAFFDGTRFTFGDGDGVTTTPFVSIDVVGHEMTHGVTFKTSNLLYSGESGGLNEGSSDIMGIMIKYYAANPYTPPNYLVADRVYTVNAGVAIPSFGRRYLFKPSLDNVSPDCYSTAVAGMDPHQASAIANHFFYLLAEGAVVPAGFPSLTPQSLVCDGNVALTGIGRTAATKIWYRALTVYFTSNTNYAAARTATLRAAADLYGTGSPTHLATAAAWQAVSVTGPMPVAATSTKTTTSRK